MQISTIIRIGIDAVKEAILSQAADIMTIPDDASSIIEYDETSGEFILEISAAVSQHDTESGDSTEPEKKPRRRRRTKAEIEADEAAAKVEAEAASNQPAEAAEDKPVTTGSVFETEGPAVKAEEEAPFEFDTNHRTSMDPPKIFPDSGSSAAPSTKPETIPDSAVAAKSLFANLTSPVN